MNHWIRHTDLSSWKKFVSVVFLILCASRSYAVALKGSTAGAVIERGSPSSVHLSYNHEIEGHGRSSLHPFFSQSQSLDFGSGGSLNETLLQGSDSITIFPNFDPYNHDPGVFGERIESALALFKTPRNLSWINFFDPPSDFGREMRTKPFP